MSDETNPATGLTNPEQAHEQPHVIVTGDCGHHFPVSVIHFDGSDFACPVCGQIDHLDPRALEAAKAEIGRQRTEGTASDYNEVVGKLLSGDAEKK